MAMLGLLLICLVTLLPIIYGYPNGAPTTTCSSLTPVHQGNQPQKSRLPFQITTSKNGNKIRVTISGEREFRGFVMQARYARNPSVLVEGKFSTTPGYSQAIDCGNGRQNTLTQVNREPKSQIVTEWTPRTAINDDIIFRATVVRAFNEFWTEVESQSVRVNTDATETPTDEPDSQRIYDDCGVNKGCFGYPSGCDSRGNCQILLSFFSTGDGISFTMIGSLDSQEYMATALSTDPRMGDDGVTECFLENGNVVMQNSWNRGKSNTPLRVIPEGMYEGQYSNGLVRCSWIQPYVSPFNEGSSDQKIFHLNNNTYYSLLAKGPMVNGRVSQHTGRLATTQSVNFSAFESLAGETAHDAVKIHGHPVPSSGVTIESYFNGTENDISDSQSGDSMAGSAHNTAFEGNTILILASMIASLQLFRLHCHY